jgi:hypothetical protein
LLFGGGKPAVGLPGVQLFPFRIDRGPQSVLLAMNREPFLFFPPLDRPNVALEVSGDFLPGVEP